MKTPLQMVTNTLNKFKEQLEFTSQGRATIDGSIDIINLTLRDFERQSFIDFAIKYHNEMCKQMNVEPTNNGFKALIMFDEFFNSNK